MRDFERKPLTFGDIFIRFIILVFVAIILMALQLTGRLMPIQSAITQITSAPQLVITSVSDSVTGWAGSARRLRTLGAENNQLTTQNADLRARIVQLEEQLVGYNLARESLNFAEINPDVQLSGAQIVARRIGEESSNFRDFLLLDLGSEHGIGLGMPVITNAGLVGRISEVNISTSKVLLISDPNSQVNAILPESRLVGIIQGNPGGQISLDFIREGAPINIGATILTSGSSISTGNSELSTRRFPRGIPIGTVVELIDSDELLSRRAIVEPFVPLDRLELVLVITNFDSSADDMEFLGVDALSPEENIEVEDDSAVDLPAGQEPADLEPVEGEQSGEQPANAEDN